MKRLKSVIILPVLSLLLSGCGREGVSPEPKPGQGVPIRFARSSSICSVSPTKAAIRTLDGLELGVLALDPSREVDPSDSASVLLYNEHLSVSGSAIGFVDESGDKTICYPSNESEYVFYAYHVSDEPLSQTGEFTPDGSFEVPVELGRTDVLWAKAEAPELHDPTGKGETLGGFNRGYALNSRLWYPGDDSYNPSFSLQHLTTHLNFIVTALDEEAENSLGESFRITSVTLEGLPASAVLNVAEGSLEAGEYASSFTLEPASAAYPTLQGTAIGEGVFTSPELESFTLSYEFIFEGKTYSSFESISVQAPEGGYKAGYTYNYKIVVKSYDEVLLLLSQMEGDIEFEDIWVRQLCVSHFDLDGDGELSYKEAAKVSSIGTLFKSNTRITSFAELQYFTSLEGIGEDAFFGCSYLATIHLPASVESIGRRAFFGCNSLTDIYLHPKTPPAFSQMFIFYSEDLTFHVPSESLEAYREAWGSAYNFAAYDYQE